MKKITKKLYIITALLLSFAFSLPVLAAKDDKLPDTYISMSPVNETLTLNPGSTYSGELTVANIGAKSFDYELSAKPFSISDKNYSINYGEETKYTEISKWISFDIPGGHLEPNSTQKVKYNINVPSKVTPGGQYVALTATTAAKEESQQGGANFTIGKSVAMILYVTIPGDLNHSGNIIENKIPQFFFDPPISVNSLLSNSGNVHEDAEYILEVRSFFGDEVVYSNAETPLTHTIFPESERYETIAWEQSPQLGIFKVKQTIKYLGQTSIEEKIVFICPLWLIFLIVFMIFLAFFYIRSKVKERKKNQAEV